MLVKIAIIFLAVMVALAMFGVLRKRPKQGVCRKCGRHIIGGTCGCRR
ncbi:hypothetical protein [Falsirhodobacter xinxiangensis]|nr:hypothetical protein [Rhodobacter xinxiangensis]